MVNSFLTDRFQCAVVEHCFSEWRPVLSGIPEGTVLGPLLFILFIDDIGIICDGTVTHKLFADDLKLYTAISTNHDTHSLQSALDRLQLWCCDWQLTINIEKCHILHIGKQNSHVTF